MDIEHMFYSHHERMGGFTMYWHDSPRSETYLRADLADILRAIARAGAGPTHARVTLRDADYADGFRAAIEAMAAALGIPIDPPALRRRDPRENPRLPSGR
jgi:hypothetical protein